MLSPLNVDEAAELLLDALALDPEALGAWLVKGEPA